MVRKNLGSAEPTWSWSTCSALFLLVIAGLFILLPTLENGRLGAYDESAMIAFARQMLAAGKYAFTVDSLGNYALAGFSKPPLVLWGIAASIKLFGATLFASRLPFALSLIGLSVFAFLWARRLLPGRSGIALGLLWGSLLIVSDGGLKYGTTACIEVVLAFWCIGALYFFAAIDGRSRAFDLLNALACGFFLSAAFMTKQIAAGVVVIPVVALALSRWRSGKGRALATLTVAGLPPLGVAAGWLWWLYSTVGPQTFDFLFGRSVEQRMGGFTGTRHFNWLNRYSDLVASCVAPVPLGAGVAGLLWLAFSGPSRGTNRFREALLLYAASALIIFGLVSRSVVEWYAFHLLFPLAAGAAWLLVVGAKHALTVKSREQNGKTETLEMGAAALLVFVFIDATVDNVLSRLATLLVIGVLAGFLVLVLRRIDQHGLGARPTGIITMFLLGALLCTNGLRLFMDSRIQDGPSMGASLMRILHDRGLTHVSVQRSLLGKDRERQILNRRRIVYYGTDAVKGIAPWAGGPHDVKARVELTPVPTEVKLPAGLHLQRGRGGVVYWGNLARPPWTLGNLQRLLNEGPLTYEAEYLPTSHLSSLSKNPDASGGEVRTVKPWLSKWPPRRPLALSPRIRLPPGKYTAIFWVSWKCSGFALKEVVATLHAGAARQSVRCEPGDLGQDDFVPVPIEFSLRRAGEISLQLVYRQGTVSLDRIEVWQHRLWLKMPQAKLVPQSPALATAPRTVPSAASSQSAHAAIPSTVPSATRSAQRQPPLRDRKSPKKHPSWGPLRSRGPISKGSRAPVRAWPFAPKPIPNSGYEGRPLDESSARSPR